MAYRVTRRECSECPCPIENRGRSSTHNICTQCGNKCQGSAQAKKFDAARDVRSDIPPYTQFEPQRITEAPGPLGRPLDDPRNNPRLNERRQTEDGFLNPVRVAVIDIETSGLNAGFGVLFCMVGKTYAPNERRIFRADEYEPWRRGERANDRDLLQDILSWMEDIDIIIAHNGLKFDLPFLRTRAVVHGLPAVNFQKIIDPVQLARQHFRFPSNSLDSISRVIGTQAEKTPLRPETWARVALNGDPTAMQEVVDHCIADVDVLEEICWKLRGYVKQIDKAGSYRSG